ncbi:MAG: TonB-dependent receptor [Novosphingobium lindaniclasticum]|jgi:outer membrane receptor protein involved in Fe transport|uniref:TonB-dependent receptor domain-containing protein n=1 Tax=Novosphingobium lindaniclasticum TaxID=1329895 RepID=UPI002409F936|nr:TonB-dependent receptor [Novosphingobium lindaniclasticum]MDF2639379.1 TonB-dependent receptor [Novosphingobium lindaniclasticum]
MRGQRKKLYCAAALTAIIAGTAQAQEAAPGGDIVVTGTRIKRPDLESNSPQTVVGSDEFRYQGATTVEQVLNRLPQFTADANENVSNGSDGTSKINLRNLGSNRVLTLLDGQRLMPSQAINLSFIPSALVERVDVLSGGASAVYGSDALSGVVNFVLKKDLDGVRIDAQTGFSQHNNNNGSLRALQRASGYDPAPSSVIDGGKQDVTIAAGKNFADGRGNITVYGGYRKFSPVRQSSRDVSACALQDRESVAGSGNFDQLFCGGSSNTPFGSFIPLSDLSPFKGQTLINNRDGSGTLVPYNPSYSYNTAPDNYFQRSDERITAGGFARFELSKAAELYGSFMYMNDQTFSQVAPSAVWFGTAFPVSCNNPYASAAQLSAICGSAAGTDTTAPTNVGYRVIGAPRRDNLRFNDYRYSAGVRGDLGSGFSYDINYMYSLVKFKETYLNDVNQAKAGRALNAVNVNGVPTCRSVIDGTDPSCIPINVFTPGGVTADQASYLFGESNTASRNSLGVISGSLSGDLGQMGVTLPWAENGVGIALGLERRRETLNFTADEVAQQNGTLPSDGIIAVTEAFGEIEIPLIEDKPFFKSLTINGGLRYSSYDNKQNSSGIKSGYNVWTYKGELSWAPVDDLRVRASYNRAIRAPNVQELFASQSVGNVNGTDPCAGANPSAPFEICQLTGVTQAMYGSIPGCPSDQCSGLGGGNVALKPETADTYTLGVVITPKALRRFSLSVDYYNIKVKDYIGSIAPSLIMGQCAETGDPYFCNLFVRDPRSGQVFGQNSGYIISTTMNTGYLKTSGLDVNADYTFDIGNLGSINLGVVGTYLIEQVSQPVPGGGSYDCKGLFGYTCGQPTPEWRHVARLSWMTPTDTTVSLSWRHLGGTTLSSLTDNPLLSADQTTVNRKIGAYNYFDLSLTQAIDKRFTLRAGVNNMFDKDPPILDSGLLQSFGNGNTYPGVYDALGRTIFVGFTANF